MEGLPSRRSIAGKVSYKTVSAVYKRIAKIAVANEDFVTVEYGKYKSFITKMNLMLMSMLFTLRAFVV